MPLRKRLTRSHITSLNSISKPSKLTTTKRKDLLTGNLETFIQPPKPKTEPKYLPDTLNKNRRYWLIKSEPETRIDPITGKDVKFPLSSLIPLDLEPWTGVRNYEARNNMIQMSKGDWCLFYHSNCKTPGIVGLVEVVNEVQPDKEQFDSKSGYYDAKSTIENPKWWCVDVRFLRRFRAKITLDECRKNGKLSDMGLVKRGRLSVTDLSKEHLEEIFRMENDKDIDDLSLDCFIEQRFIKMPEDR